MHWLLYILITLQDGNTVVAPLYDYKDERQPCVERMVELTKWNKNKEVAFTCAEWKPKGEGEKEAQWREK